MVKTHRCPARSTRFCIVAVGALSARPPLPTGTSSPAGPDRTLGESKAGLRHETVGALLLASSATGAVIGQVVVATVDLE